MVLQSIRHHHRLGRKESKQDGHNLKPFGLAEITESAVL